MTGAPCEFLEWDSEFFGVRIGRIQGHLLTRNSLVEISDWARANEIACLYFFAHPDDRETARIAEESGFSLVDIRVTYEQRLMFGVHQSTPERVRMFEPKDLQQLKEIACKSHIGSRFYFDGRFRMARCNELFELWIERSCLGWADAVFVAYLDEEPVGYITCHLQPGGDGRLGLAAVAERAQSQGLGMQLVHAALRYFEGRQVECVKVVTQGRNRASQRLFQRSGFLIDRMELTYHWWL
jgi:ribosomal protein S18 acetylase RimI-like enzyme